MYQIGEDRAACCVLFGIQDGAINQIRVEQTHAFLCSPGNLGVYFLYIEQLYQIHHSALTQTRALAVFFFKRTNKIQGSTM